MPEKADLLSVVEAAYEVDAPTDRWNAKLLKATNIAVDAGLGGFASEFAWSDGRRR
jgi:hypothetical protein